MNLGEARARMAYRLGFKTDQADQDFAGPSTDTNRRLDNFYNTSRFEELQLAAEEAGTVWMQRDHEDTWPANTLLHTLPTNLQEAQLRAIYDITANSGEGDPLWMGDRFSGSTLVWRNSKTLEWRDGGPGSDRTLRYLYVAQPAEFTEATDECDIIPSRHHNLYVLAASVRLREVADESAPKSWVTHRNELRHLLWKELSQTRPLWTGPRQTHQPTADFY